MAATTSLAQDVVRPVKLQKIDQGQTEATRQFFGHVVAKETVDLAFQVGGQLIEFPVIEGQALAKGQMIAQLDLEPYELALDQAVTQKSQIDREMARLEQLTGNTVSAVRIEDTQTQVELAQLAVRNAERQLKQATLYAPFDALVSSKNVATFTTLGAGTPVVRLHDMSDLRIEIDVPEVLFQQASRNPDFEVHVKFPANDTLFPVDIREYNAETSAVGQTFSLTFGLQPPEELVILPGSSATIIATQRGLEPRIVVPNSAIVTGNDGATYVKVFEANADSQGNQGTVRSQRVEIEPTPRGQVFVTSGLEAGQEIVVSGASRVQDGQTVRRFTGFPK